MLAASEAPRAPLNGSRLVLNQLCTRLAERAEITVLALRHPDQVGEAPAGIELHELALSPPGRGRAWALRGAALALRDPFGGLSAHAACRSPLCAQRPGW